jgi:hypothetical protein
MAQMGRDGEASGGTAEVELSLIERQLADMERPADGQRSVWPWVLVVVGVLVIAGLGFQGYTAFTTIARINVNSKIDTPNVVLLFQDVATNGPKVGATVESSSRATYTKGLEQFLLDGTGVIGGLMLVIGGAFVRVNQ